MQSPGRKAHSQHDLCFLFQDLPWRSAPWARYSLPSASWAWLQTPWAHTALPGMAGSPWGAGSAPSRRAASSHAHAMGAQEGLWKSGFGSGMPGKRSECVMLRWRHQRKLGRKFLPCPAEVQIPPETRSEQLPRHGCLFSTALSLSCLGQPGKQPSLSGAGHQGRSRGGVPAAPY